MTRRNSAMAIEANPEIDCELLKITDSEFRSMNLP
jgi:hypothetical protein